MGCGPAVKTHVKSCQEDKTTYECKIIIKVLTEDAVQVSNYTGLEISATGIIKAATADGFEVKGKIEANGEVKWSKTDKDKKVTAYTGTLKGAKIEGTFAGEDKVNHNFSMTIGIETPPVDGKSFFYPIEPYNDATKKLYAFAFDEAGTIEGKPEKGIWGLVVLEPAKEKKREGKFYTFDGKASDVKFEVGDKFVQLNFAAGAKKFNDSKAI